jgi:Putative MetA-pathway of phenol degradation
MRAPALALFLLLLAASASAEPEGIQDNSFLIEEAYNQEPGVVQHISLFRKDPRTGEWAASFTQEWPLGGIRHQVSYTVTYLRVAGDIGDFTGFGDVALNYRYQLVGSGETKMAVAPRFTVLLPSGSARKELGLGSVGLQVGLPASLVLSNRFVAHANLGFTWAPREKDPDGDRADAVAGSAGGSLIWLARPGLNLLLEGIWTRAQIVTAPGQTRTVSAAFVSPGVRWSYDFRSGLQIVPGIGFPIGVGSSHGRYGVLVYLSFEHPFSSAAKK